MRDGIFVSQVHNRGPAVESGQFKVGMSLDVTWENLNRYGTYKLDTKFFLFSNAIYKVQQKNKRKNKESKRNKI